MHIALQNHTHNLIVITVIIVIKDMAIIKLHERTTLSWYLESKHFYNVRLVEENIPRGHVYTVIEFIELASFLQHTYTIHKCGEITSFKKPDIMHKKMDSINEQYANYANYCNVTISCRIIWIC
jgi:hypothetical protein